MFNDENSHACLLTRIARVIEGLPGDWEVILVNDGSSDGSLSKLKELQGTDRRFKVLSLSRNFGQQAAIAAGLSKSSGKTVTVLDADLQDPPELIPQMLREWEGGKVSVICGVRRRRQGEPWLKRLTAFLFYRLMRAISESPIPVDAGEFRMMDRRVVNLINASSERSLFLRGSVSWLGFSYKIVHFDRSPRQSGVSHYTYRKLVRLALDGIVASSGALLRLAWFVAMGLILLGIGTGIGAMYSLHMSLSFLAQALGVVSLLSFFGVVQVLLIAIVGEYVGRIFIEVQNRPRFIIEEEIGF